MSESLKPCPFCGGKAYLSKLKTTVNIRFFVVCGNTKCIASADQLFGKRYYSENEAIEAWNRRVNNES